MGGGRSAGAQIPSSPDRSRDRFRQEYGVNAAKQAREFHPQGAIRGCEQIERSRLTIFAKSVK